MFLIGQPRPLFLDDFVNLMTGSTNDGREYGTGCVVTGESGFAHAGAVVDDESGGVFVTHLRRDGRRIEMK